jgi:hypothetical protein
MATKTVRYYDPISKTMKTKPMTAYEPVKQVSKPSFTLNPIENIKNITKIANAYKTFTPAQQETFKTNLKYPAKKAGMGVAGFGAGIADVVPSGINRQVYERKTPIKDYKYVNPLEGTSKQKNFGDNAMKVLTNLSADAMTFYRKHGLIGNAAENLGKVSANYLVNPESAKAEGFENEEAQAQSIYNKMNKVTKPYYDAKAKLDAEGAKLPTAIQQTGNITEGIGNMAPSLLVSLLTGNPEIGLMAMSASAGGSAAKEATLNGANPTQAEQVGIAKGALEYGTEKIFSGFKLLPKGAVSEGLQKVLKGFANTQTGKAALKVLNTVGEGGEEVFSQALDSYIDRAIYDPDAKNATKEELFQAGGMGVVISAILGSFGGNTKVKTPVLDTILGKDITNQIKSAPDINVDTKQTTGNWTPEELQQMENVRQLTQKTVESIPTIAEKLGVQKTSEILAEDFFLNATAPIKQKTNTSNFADSVQETDLLNAESKAAINDVNMDYTVQTNDNTIKAAVLKLQMEGQNAIDEWNSKKTNEFKATDVALGYYLIDKYQGEGNTDGLIRTVRKLREAGTEAGRTTQSYAILSRLTPEGMIKYAQTELDDFFKQYSAYKTSDWISKNKAKYELTKEDVDFISDRMTRAQTAQKGSVEQQLLISDVMTRIQSKMPSSLGSKLKAWQRISLLMNPKTILRNIVGNAIMEPLSAATDAIATPIDKLIARTTGIRTTGLMNPKAMLKGGWKGINEAVFDYKNNVQRMGDKWEIKEGSAFNPAFAKTEAGKRIFAVLDRMDKITSFMLDVGDRPFLYGYFNNSIENQIRLNGVTEPTADMIEIAEQESLQRTWQDNNGFTKAMSATRKGLNWFFSKFGLGSEEFGFGDIMIPFVRTPANMLKAIFDFSPIGLTKSLTNDLIKFNRTVENGTNTALAQKNLVNSIGKGVTGTLIFILGWTLAAAGIITGSGDDDKDKAGFEKNVQGMQPYSIQIGDKTYTYSWAQPVGSALAIAADMQKAFSKEEKNASDLTDLLSAVAESLSAGVDSVFDLSLVQGIADFMGAENKPMAGLDIIAGLPAQFVPTILNQIGQLIDPVSRKQYVSGNPIETGANKVLARIPGLSKTLEPVTDTFGREVLKYGGDNNPLNVFFNPANVSSVNTTLGSNEILRVYDATGAAGVFPRVAPSSIQDGDNTYTLSMQEKTAYQKTMGALNDEISTALTKNNMYNSAPNEDKANMLTDMVSYSNAVAKQEYLRSKGEDWEPEAWVKNAQEYITSGGKIEDYIALRSLSNTGYDEKTAREKKTILLASGMEEADLQSAYKVNFENVETNPLKSVDYAVNNGVPASTYINYKTQDFEGKGGTAKSKQWLLDNVTDENQLATMWNITQEDKDDKEENTIAYAMEQGVTPSSFIKRSLQATTEEGDKTVGTDVTLTDGKAITTAGEDTVAGTKKRESMTNLLESGFNNEEKLYFYQKENPEDDKFVFAMVAGIPVDEYLTLKRDEWSIEGKKDANGKTITGTKKAAYFAYLDTLGLDDAQKGILMIQGGYSVDSGVKSAVVEYINGLGLSDADKTSLLSSLKLTDGNGSGKAKKATLPSIKTGAKARIGSLNLPSLQLQSYTTNNGLQSALNSIKNVISPEKIKKAALQVELDQVDKNKLLTAKQKIARKQAIRKRYEQ